MNTETQPIDLSTLSSKELKALLAEREREEKREQAEAIAKYERDRDRFVNTRLKEFEDASERLREMKQRIIVEANELHDRMYIIKGQEPKKLKNYTLLNADGTKKIEVERAERMALNETAEVHIDIIKQVLAEKFEARNKTMYKIINTILMKNTKGEYDERLVAKLSAVESDVEDERFSNALADLRAAFYSTESATYARCYKLNDATGQWDNVNIQFSSL